MSILTASNSVATTGTDDILREAAQCFFHEVGTFSKTTGGVNNVVQYLDQPNGKRYVLRIYNNGYNTQRVVFEHAILDKIRKMHLSFSVPTFLPCLSTGDSYAILSDGSCACMCELIHGTLPKLNFAKPIGRACGELVAALASLDDPASLSSLPPSPNPTYFNIYAAHHATTKENFHSYIRDCSDFDAPPHFSRPSVAFLASTLDEMEEKMRRWKESSLPEQWIHADLHYLNVLVEEGEGVEGEEREGREEREEREGRVTGCLDFEFSVRDWRAMELAVALSKYAGEKEGLSYFSALCQGFAEHVKLSVEEREAVSDMVIIRILSNVIYFVGRAISGEDSIEALTSRARMYEDRVKWIQTHSEDILTILHSCMTE